MARGGRRQATPGKSYGNRLDLNEATTSGQYGDRVASERRMQAVPITPPQAVAPPQASPARLPTPPVALTAPTDRPMEPITSGLPMGAGPGPEALGLDSGGLEKLRPMLPVLELLASRPGVGADARNLVRRLRGGLG